jgi:hypothetical protein
LPAIRDGSVQSNRFTSSFAIARYHRSFPFEVFRRY